MKKTQMISTICRMCPQGCGLEVTLKNGRPVSLKGAKDHPYSKGWLCVKGRAALDLLHSPNRLSSPLIRKEGKLVSVKWEEALDFCAKRLHRLRDLYGPQSLAIYQGEGIGHHPDLRWCNQTGYRQHEPSDYLGRKSHCIQ